MANVLIIDDDEIVRKYVASLATRMRHTVFEAGTCAEGLALMSNPSINVIIADIFLPDSPPFKQWVYQLKTASAGRPLILITGEPSPELTALVEKSEIQAFLTKPFELASIKNLIAEFTSTPPAPKK